MRTQLCLQHRGSCAMLSSDSSTKEGRWQPACALQCPDALQPNPFIRPLCCFTVPFNNKNLFIPQFRIIFRLDNRHCIHKIYISLNFKNVCISFGYVCMIVSVRITTCIHRKLLSTTPKPWYAFVYIHVNLFSGINVELIQPSIIYYQHQGSAGVYPTISNVFRCHFVLWCIQCNSHWHTAVSVHLQEGHISVLMPNNVLLLYELLFKRLSID